MSVDVDQRMRWEMEVAVACPAKTTHVSEPNELSSVTSIHGYSYKSPLQSIKNFHTLRALLFLVSNLESYITSTSSENNKLQSQSPDRPRGLQNKLPSRRPMQYQTLLGLPDTVAQKTGSSANSKSKAPRTPLDGLHNSIHSFYLTVLLLPCEETELSTRRTSRQDGHGRV
ncbi:hypothetical protein ACRALDRAFT_205263 [Sodiomyces alcalophilus JCM 7366]|uniref:uncharacterized protein n=1 Tax=Sodiomyces alcalophilus JCM 7366 TaxID=591952 RepID=UPI0039B5731E